MKHLLTSYQKLFNFFNNKKNKKKTKNINENKKQKKHESYSRFCTIKFLRNTNQQKNGQAKGKTSEMNTETSIS